MRSPQYDCVTCGAGEGTAYSPYFNRYYCERCYREARAAVPIDTATLELDGQAIQQGLAI